MLEGRMKRYTLHGAGYNWFEESYNKMRSTGVVYSKTKN